MEILRHNNISDNANAFNRILSLLLCKIVDEQKEEDEVLDFQVKEGEDTPERIQDRLQKLYAQGMKKYLDEEIVYFEDEEIQNIIEHYRETPIEQIENMFKQIKYYTQNEFAIKEVHNRELFLQNARVLNEIIKMLQNYQFRYSKKQQMLGDFFELLLNHGIKQNEGQFFTPVPIVRFMILSLGLDKIAKKKLTQKQDKFLPKILDFACGAGHFLTESIDELQHFIEHMQDTEIEENEKKLLANIKQYKQSTEWAKDYIFGIEKDYRLARTSQIACFLNGDGDANIIFGDGLENHERLNLKEKFDVILSNPPYSIKSFKNYVSHEVSQNFTLFKQLTESSKEIETLFVERTAQLLKDGARAAVILPSPILSNDSELHQQTRRVLLEHFNIKAIASFGSGTFGATGTNTVILFLEKRNPNYATDRRYISEDIFRQIERDSYLDRERLLQKFIHYRNLEVEDYKTLMCRNPNESIQKQTFYKDYQNWFEGLAEIKKLKAKPSFQKLSENELRENEQKQELEKRFYDKILQQEQEKFYYFMLTLKDDLRIKATNGEAYKQQKTIIIQSGEKQSEKTFLGYEFSSRKGNEGIKINRNPKGQAINKMYDDDDHYNSQKANSYILKHFENEPFESVDESLQDHLKVATLSDMLDFEKVDFSNGLSLNPKINTEITSQWKLVKLGKIAEIIKGVTFDKDTQTQEETRNKILTADNISLTGDFELKKIIYLQDSFEIDIEKKLTKDDIFMCFSSGSLKHLGKVAYIKSNTDYYAGGFMGLLRAKDDIVHPKYLYEILNSTEVREIVRNKGTGSNIKNLSNTINEIKIPLPEKPIQKKIVSECKAVDEAKAKAEQTIEEAKKEIEQEVQQVINAGYKMKKIGEIFETSSGGTPSSRNTEYYQGGDIPWINSGEVSKRKIFKADKYITELGLKNSSAKLFPKDTVLLAMYGATAGKVALLNIEATTNQALCAFLPTKEVLPYFLLLHLETMYQTLLDMRTGVARDNLSQEKIKNIKIPVPPLEEQNKLIAVVEKLEEKINYAKATIDNAQNQKQTILDKYLK